MDKEFKCVIENCHNNYTTQRGLNNHLSKVHNIIQPPSSALLETGKQSGSLSSSPVDNDGFDKEQLELAMELSVKDHYKEFIPTDEQICDIKNQKLCIMCASTAANIAFIDCGHVVACYECAIKIKNAANKQERRCPNCRKFIKNIIKIYI